MDMSGLSSLSDFDLSGLSAGGSTQDPTFQPSQEQNSGECWLKMVDGCANVFINYRV
jgi:hypothetical protein